MAKVIVTTSWDDGHILDLELAELLQKYGIKGTFYICPNFGEIPASECLSEAQIRELSKNFEIGAHTMTHPNLENIEDGEALREIVASKKYLENVLNKPVDSFCYPSGYFNARHEQMVKESGFKLARTVERFAKDIGDNPFALPTTVHAYRHCSDAFSILRAVGIKKFISCYLNWDELAINLFDSVAKNGGVFHLWGHSWEVEKNNDWKRLEKVLNHIAGRQSVRYAVNTEIL